MVTPVYNTDLESFRALWQRCLKKGVKDTSSVDLHRRLVMAYAEPHRAYHTLTHIQGCFDIFHPVQQQVDNADALALAIWFHDAIYDIDADDNEQRSADWFLQETENLFPENLRKQVNRHIMATMHCGKDIADLDSQIMIDIDLFSFAKPWTEFMIDSENVRAEKSDIPDHEFYPRQCGFQQILLNRPRFFQSDYFYRYFEDQARQNLSRFIAMIEQKLSDIKQTPTSREQS